ncbi:Cholesterol 7-alpha-monooxygenase [Branchiostoma belcheri]|nr:Cholesterol 7-alpha-monooxygenase [Branchiostoma belcheri]
MGQPFWNNNKVSDTVRQDTVRHTVIMWSKILSIFTCCLNIKPNKVHPGGSEETVDREKAEPPVIPVTSPPVTVMSQPRLDRSSDHILAQLRDEGVLLPGQVPTENPGTPPRHQDRQKEMERRLEERREKVKKSCLESRGDLKKQLSDAEVRRQELLAKRTAMISKKFAEKAAGIKTKKEAREMTSTAFVITDTSSSDSDVIATRASQSTKQMEERLEARRARVAKKATVDALETRQNLAAERRQDHKVATVCKAKMLAKRVRFNIPDDPGSDGH